MTNERREDLFYYFGGLKTQLDAGDWPGFAGGTSANKALLVSLMHSYHSKQGGGGGSS